MSAQQRTQELTKAFIINKIDTTYKNLHKWKKLNVKP
jgi:hypothetical protein